MNTTSVLRTLGVSVLPFVLSTLLMQSALANTEAAPSKKTVNVNQASASQLALLPRVGPKLAEKIIAQRTQSGGFKRAEDLMEVKGIGEKMFATLKPYVSVSGPTTLTEKVSSANKKTITKPPIRDDGEKPAAK